MPISGVILGNLIFVECSGQGFTGSKLLQLSNALGNGIVNSILATAIYTGTSTGLGIGVGASTGTLAGSIIIGPAIGSLIFSQMGLLGLLGSKTLSLSTAIGNAVATHMSTAIVTGSSTIVATGAGTGTIVGVVGSAMGSMINLQMTAFSLTGTDSVKLANAIGNGVALAIQASLVTTSIVGVPIGVVPPAFPPIPSVGTDIGRLI
ncbi:MAG: hypothetical protein Q7R33_01940 [Nitrosarchaeum sp.]|nr:hypothetical protein [Nitrosarchaeum sp.]